MIFEFGHTVDGVHVLDGQLFTSLSSFLRLTEVAHLCLMQCAYFMPMTILRSHFNTNHLIDTK